MICENALFLRLLNFFMVAMTVLRVAVPIGLILKLVLDIYHGIIDVNDNSIKDKIIHRIAACIIIFLVPTIVNVFCELLETVTDSNFNYTECMDNVKNIDSFVED